VRAKQAVVAARAGRRPHEAALAAAPSHDQGWKEF